MSRQHRLRRPPVVRVIQALLVVGLIGFGWLVVYGVDRLIPAPWGLVVIIALLALGGVALAWHVNLPRRLQ